MDVTYKNRKLERSLTDDSLLVKKYGDRAKKVKQRLTLLKTAPTLFDISRLPPTRLHQYKGERKGEWSIDIKDNWRIIFEIISIESDISNKSVNKNEINAIKIISIEDPH